MLSIRSLIALQDFFESERDRFVDGLIKDSKLEEQLFGEFENYLRILVEQVIDNSDNETSRVYFHRRMQKIGFADPASFKKKWEEIAVAWQRRIAVRVDEDFQGGLTTVSLSLPQATETESAPLDLLLWDGKQLHTADVSKEFWAEEVLDEREYCENLAETLVRRINEGSF